MMFETAQNPYTASKAVHYMSQPIARSKKQSAVYYAAYVTGMDLHDVRRDKIFWRKDSQGDVLYWEIVGPPGAQNWTLAELWNGAETAAKKVNERPGRQTVIALPHEICQGDRAAAWRVARGHCLWLRDEYGLASTWALHAPNPDAFGEGAKNWHIHIVETDRRMSIDSAGRPVFGPKVRELTDGKQGKVELERRRADWEKRVNAELELAGVANRVSMGKTAQGEGPDYLPGVHRGPQVNAMLRKHQTTARTAMAAGEPLPQVPPRLAALFAHAEARQSANAASRSFWAATGQAVSQMTRDTCATAILTAGAALVQQSGRGTLAAQDSSTMGTTKDDAALVSEPRNDGADDVDRDDAQARARETRSWERFWQDEARKAAAQRQRQR